MTKNESYSVIISDQGERTSMEDRHALIENFGDEGDTFGGVYDGHGGNATAEMASEELHREFKKVFGSKMQPDKAFEMAYKAIHEQVVDKSGTCATDFYIKGNRIYFANVGDCRIIITGTDVARQLTIDDSVFNKAECQRVIEAGAIQRGNYFWKGYAGTQVTRSIGDREFSDIGIIPEPHTGFTDILATDSYLIAASDGLFKYVSNEEIQNISKDVKSAEELGEILKEKVLVDRKGSDNLTIIIFDLRNI